MHSPIRVGADLHSSVTPRSSAVALGEDAQVVVSGGFDGTVWLWDTRIWQMATA